MKKVITLFIVLLIFGATTLFAQSASYELQAKGLKDSHFIPLKMEKIDGSATTTYMFSSVSTYNIKIKNGEKQIVVKILDEEKKEIVSNYDEKNKKYLKKISFRSPKTALYYLTFQEIN
jgi:hypothetical protein